MNGFCMGYGYIDLDTCTDYNALKLVNHCKAMGIFLLKVLFQLHTDAMAYIL